MEPGDQTVLAESIGLDYLAKENPLSIYNCVTDSFRHFLDQIPYETWALVTDNSYIPHGSSDILLKMKLWEMYSTAKISKLQINITQLADGVCNRTTVHRILDDPKRLAFLFLPPKNYQNAIDAAQELWLSRMFEILSLPIRGPNGAINTTVANLVLKAGIAVDMRKHGSPLMRSEQKNLNVNVTKELPASLEDIDAKLAELEQAVNDGVLPAPRMDSIDAEFEDVT